MAGETQKELKRRKERKRKHPASASPLILPNEASFFPLVLASCANMCKPYAQQILVQLLRAQLAFVRGRGRDASIVPVDQILYPGLLSLLPVLLNQTRSYAVSVLAAELVGAIALFSLDANEGVASDDEIVRAVVAALGDPRGKVAMGACNAVLDLAAGPTGREQLRESFAVEKLLSVFCQVAAVPTSLHSCSAHKERDDSSILGHMEDIFLASVLDAARLLINTSNSEFLDKTHKSADGLCRRFLVIVEPIWLRYSSFRGRLSSTEHDLAETIFRLSMNQSCYSTSLSFLVRRSMFGSEQCDFENFVINYWEKMPILLRNGSKNENIVFNCFDFSSKTIDSAIDSILQNLVSCPPISSDELDILNFLEEVKGVLGSPIVYGQDIRLVKTEKLLSMSGKRNGEQELQYNCCTSSSVNIHSVLNCNYVQKCKEAAESGYTIALRGLEFRFKKIAGLSDGLAALFGQPSVGANIYLTPPESQGLSRHYDDHCVFVCQLLGAKRWMVFPQSVDSVPLLPRLYESPHDSSLLEVGSNFGDGEEFFLHEGDILYIPRGCPHEAYTTASETDSMVNQSTFSLHLTLAVEVEPPFEWEGFAHVALCCWVQKQKENYSVDCTLGIPNFMIINLLHIAIWLLGDCVPVFRKACLVAAMPQSDNGSAMCAEQSQRLTSLQKSIFDCIINTIDVQSSFVDAYRKIKDTVHEKKGNFFPSLQWLRHLSAEEDDRGMFELKAFEEFLLSAQGCIEVVESMFVQVKHKFCMSITFDDARKDFEELQYKYKKTRRQYMNGMLALHSAS